MYNHTYTNIYLYTILRSKNSSCRRASSSCLSRSYKHICICIHTRMYMYICIYIYKYVYIHTSIMNELSARRQAFSNCLACAYIYMYIYIHTYMFVCMFVCECACVCERECARESLCVCRNRIFFVAGVRPRHHPISWSSPPAQNKMLFSFRRDCRTNHLYSVKRDVTETVGSTPTHYHEGCSAMCVCVCIYYHGDS